MLRALSMAENQNINWQKTPFAMPGHTHIGTEKLKKGHLGNCGNYRLTPLAESQA